MAMHLLYCDESNMEDRPGDFLIYAGIAIDGTRAMDLSREIDAIRANLNVPREYRLKFNPGPEGFSHEQFIELKRQVIDATVRHGVKLLCYLVLHDIATNPDEARRNGINTVCFHFDCLLNRLNETGLVLIDRFNDAGNQIEAHLAEKFSVGLVGMPYAAEVPMRRIVGYHYSAIGQSHFTSLIDVIVGSFRFAINAHCRNVQQHRQSTNNILRAISPLFVRNNAGGAVSELGLIFSPKIIRVSGYRSKYQDLKDFLEAAGIPTEQQITDQRMY